MRCLYNTIFFLAFFFSFFLQSCKEYKEKESETPKPKHSEATADFTIDKNIVEVFDSVTFVSHSKNAVRLEWDLGNGEFSDASSVKTNYFSVGNYPVKLTAYDKNNVPVTTLKWLTAGQRSISGFTLSKLNFVSPTGQPWDTDGSGPDVSITCTPASLASQFQIVQASWNDIRPTDLPLSKVSPDNSLGPLWQESYLISVNENSPNRVIAQWTVDPNNLSRADANGNGSFTLTSGQTELIVHFKVILLK